MCFQSNISTAVDCEPLQTNATCNLLGTRVNQVAYAYSRVHKRLRLNSITTKRPCLKPLFAWHHNHLTFYKTQNSKFPQKYHNVFLSFGATVSQFRRAKIWTSCCLFATRYQTQFISNVFACDLGKVNKCAQRGKKEKLIG
jgi:hypothetical protein